MDMVPESGSNDSTSTEKKGKKGKRGKVRSISRPQTDSADLVSDRQR